MHSKNTYTELRQGSVTSLKPSPLSLSKEHLD